MESKWEKFMEGNKKDYSYSLQNLKDAKRLGKSEEEISMLEDEWLRSVEERRIGWRELPEWYLQRISERGGRKEWDWPEPHPGYGITHTLGGKKYGKKLRNPTGPKLEIRRVEDKIMDDFIEADNKYKMGE